MSIPVTVSKPQPGTTARGAWFGLWAQAVDKLLPVLILLYLARTLGAEEFGVYSFLVAYLALFQVVSDYSLDTILVRTINQDPGRGSLVLSAGLGLKLCMAVVSAAVSVLLVGVASAGRVPWDLAVLASLILPSALGGAYRAWFRARLDIRAVMYMAAARAVLLALGVIAAVSVGFGLKGIFAATAFANLVTFVGVSVLLRSTAPAIGYANFEIWGKLLSGAWPLMLNALALTVAARAGHVLLMSMRGPVEVGMMSAASRVTESFQLLPEALMISIYPLMAEAFASGADSLIGTARRAARYLVAVVGGPVVLCAVGGRSIMITLFGDSFAEAGDILAVSAFLALLGATGAVTFNLLVAVNRERSLYRVTMFFAAAGIAVSMLLIPPYGGVGAALAMLITSLTSQIALAFLPASRKWVAPTLLAGLRAAIVVPVAIVAVWPLGHGLVAMAAAVVVYLIGLVVFGVFDEEERRFIRAMYVSGRGLKGDSTASGSSDGRES